jgi:hypothetical protein
VQEQWLQHTQKSSDASGVRTSEEEVGSDFPSEDDAYRKEAAKGQLKRAAYHFKDDHT